MNEIIPVIDYISIFIAIIALYFAFKSNLLSKRNNDLTKQIALLQGTFEKPEIQVNFGNGELLDIYYLAFKPINNGNILIPFSLDIINNGKAKAYDIEIIIQGEPDFLSIENFGLFPKQETKINKTEINKYDTFTSSKNYNSIVIKQKLLLEKSSITINDIFLKVNNKLISDYNPKNKLEYLKLYYSLKIDGKEIVSDKLIRFAVINIEKIGLKKTIELQSKKMEKEFNNIYNNLSKFQKWRYQYKSNNPLKKIDRIAILNINKIDVLKNKTNFLVISNFDLICGIKQNGLIIPKFWRDKNYDLHSI